MRLFQLFEWTHWCKFKVRTCMTFSSTMQKMSFPLHFRSFTRKATQLTNAILPLYYCRWLNVWSQFIFYVILLFDVMNEYWRCIIALHMTHDDTLPMTLFIAPPLSAYKIHCLMGACNTYLFYFYHIYMGSFY